jgi:acyl-coenzyme A thioesterase PaaI-like protein
VPDILITEVRFLKRAMGPPGHVHGGASAALIDETMGVLAWALGNASVTETLMLQYRKPIPLEEPAIIYTWIHHQKAKKITIRSELHLATKKTAVFAEGVFHRLSPEQLKQFQSKY